MSGVGPTGAPGRRSRHRSGLREGGTGQVRLDVPARSLTLQVAEEERRAERAAEAWQGDTSVPGESH